MGKIKTKKYLRDNLYRLYQRGHGVSKHSIKNVHNASPYIHSHNTYMTYRQQCDRFGKWAHEHGYTDPEVAKGAIPEYIEQLKSEGKSAWTIYTALCAVCKAFEIDTKEVSVEVPKRRREDITRSRMPVENDRHISPVTNSSLITFCQCFGLRHEKELVKVTGKQFRYRSDGRLVVSVYGKGGKWREVEFFGTAAEQKICERIIAAAGDGVLFPKTPSNFDAHYYRSVFACRAYRALARDTAVLPKQDLYICRKDMKGQIYDRRALKKVSRLLGHNRLDVVVNNYLYNL